MIKRILLIIVVLILSNISIYSQVQLSEGHNISVHGGMFRTSQENFDETYESNLGFVYGVGFGIPMSKNSYFLGKATYFSKDGVPLRKTYDIVDDKFVLVSEIKEGTAEFSQFIINGGYQHNFPLSAGYILGVNGGITYTTITEELKDKFGEIKSSIKGSGIFGFFIGCMLEKKFQDMPFTAFTEAQYNFSRNDILGITKDYSGINISIGVRYYLGGL